MAPQRYGQARPIFGVFTGASIFLKDWSPAHRYRRGRQDKRLCAALRLATLQIENSVPNPWIIRKPAHGAPQVSNVKSLVNCGRKHSEAVITEMQSHLMLQTSWL